MGVHLSMSHRQIIPSMEMRLATDALHSLTERPVPENSAFSCGALVIFDDGVAISSNGSPSSL